MQHLSRDGEILKCFDEFLWTNSLLSPDGIREQMGKVATVKLNILAKVKSIHWFKNPLRRPQPFD